jgi:hypothetical protein
MVYKFKPGDRVKVIHSGSGFPFTSVGKEYTIKSLATYNISPGYTLEEEHTQEIVGEESFGSVKKEETLLEEARRRYPKGTKYHVAHIEAKERTIATVSDPSKFWVLDSNIYESDGNFYKNGHNLSEVIHHNGKWGTIVEEEPTFKIGDIVTATSGIIDGRIISPSQVPVIGASTTTSFFTIDAASLNANESYFVIFLCWINDVANSTQISNSFYLNDLKVEAPASPLDLTTALTTIFKTWNKLTTAKAATEVGIVQNNVVQASLDKTIYDGLATTAGSPFTDVDTDLDNITIEVYDSTNSNTITTLNFARETTGGWSTLFNPFVTIGDNASKVDVTLNTRGLFGGGGGIIPDFSGTTIHYIVKYGFKYSPTDNPFDYTYVLTQPVDYTGFVCNTTPTYIESITLTDNDTGVAISNNLIGVNTIKATVAMVGTVVGDYKIIPYIDSPNYGVQLFNDYNLEQENFSASIDATNMPSLSTTKLTVTDDTITALADGEFLIDVSELTYNVPYFIYVSIYKR